MFSPILMPVVSIAAIYHKKLYKSWQGGCGVLGGVPLFL